MKILQPGVTLESWRTRVECPACSALLEVVAEDLARRRVKSYCPDSWCAYYTDIVYANCPCCGGKVCLVDEEMKPALRKQIPLSENPGTR